MSGLMNKVKDAFSGEKDTPEARAANIGNNEYGTSRDPHHEGIRGSHHKSGMDPLESDLTGKRTGDYDTTSSSGYGGGSGMTGTTGGDYGRDTSTTSGGYGSSGYDDNSRTSGAGPHSSGMMNKADPRVDSDRDGNRAMGGSRTTGDSYGRDTAGTTGGSYGSSGYDDNTRTSGAGPHSSGMMNKADPRADSDRDGRSGMGGSGSGYGSSTTGMGTSSGYDDNTRTSGAGPHSSSMMNKADPHVDSDRDGRIGLGGSGYGSSTGYDDNNTTTGTGMSGGAGPHSSSLANKADPRVDSDRDGRSGMGGATTGHRSGGGVSGKVDDLVHGGEHHTQTANALDPNVSGTGGSMETGYGSRDQSY